MVCIYWSNAREGTYIEGAVVQPYISLYRDDTIGQGSVEWLGSPVVIVGMNILGHDSLGQVRRIMIQRVVVDSENALDILRERNIGLAHNEWSRQEQYRREHDGD